jgi:hypothetical protein
MYWRTAATALKLDFGGTPVWRKGLRLAKPAGVLTGPDKYRILDLKRRRAQMRARRELGLV